VQRSACRPNEPVGNGYGDVGSWRADVLAVDATTGRRVAFEVQLKVLTIADARSRTALQRQLGCFRLVHRVSDHAGALGPCRSKRVNPWTVTPITVFTGWCQPRLDRCAEFRVPHTEAALRAARRCQSLRRDVRCEQPGACVACRISKNPVSVTCRIFNTPSPWSRQRSSRSTMLSRLSLGCGAASSCAHRRLSIGVSYPELCARLEGLPHRSAHGLA
jgi:hypothetical protein